MTRTQLPKIALIFVKFNLPSQPYLINWACALQQLGLSIKLFSHDIEMPGNVSVVEMPQAGMMETMRRTVNNCIKWPFGSLQWFSHENGLSIKGKIKIWGRHAPLIAMHPKIIHLVNAQLYPKYAFLIDLMNCTSIVSFRGYDTLVRPLCDSNWEEILSKIFNKCGCLHYVSEYLRDEGIKLGAPPEKAVVIYPGVDVNFYKPSRQKVNIYANRSLNLITVGRLEWEKGYVVALKAIKILKDKNYDIQYLIVGDGREREEMVFLTKEFGIDENVKFCGYQSSEQVKSLLNQSDIYLQPSIYEAFGVAAIEASAMELPLVASDVGGLREVVKHDHTGILVPPDASDAIAEAVVLLANDIERRIEMGNRGREKVINEFSLEKEVKGWTALYEKIMQS